MVHALIVSNMLATAALPGRGSFVRDQFQALQRLDGLHVELYEFPPGAKALFAAAVDLRHRYSRQRFDVVHAHFGLSAWPAMVVATRARALTVHGTDVHHPRTRQLTRAVLPFVGLIGAASDSLVLELPGKRARSRAQVLPCGVDLERFRPLPRETARNKLGLPPEGPYLLFPADPSRASKRYDRARAVAGDTQLLTLGAVDPSEVPLWINAANAVIVPSDREGFGLAVLEALACDVPVLATPVGAHMSLLSKLDGALCAPFELSLWKEAVAPHLRTEDPRIAGRPRAEPCSTTHMAERVANAWNTLLAQGG